MHRAIKECFRIVTKIFLCKQPLKGSSILHPKKKSFLSLNQKLTSSYRRKTQPYKN